MTDETNRPQDEHLEEAQTDDNRGGAETAQREAAENTAENAENTVDNTAENADPVPVPPTAPAPSPTTTSYFEKIVRHIPATINAAYVASLGLLAENAPNPAWLHWSVFLVLLILVPFYVLYIPGQFQDKSMSKRYCVFASTISFIVWVYAIDGGPIAISFPQLYQPLYGSLLLIITTLVLPVLEIVLQKLNYFRPENEET